MSVTKISFLKTLAQKWYITLLHIFLWWKTLGEKDYKDGEIYWLDSDFSEIFLLYVSGNEKPRAQLFISHTKIGYQYRFNFYIPFEPSELLKMCSNLQISFNTFLKTLATDKMISHYHHCSPLAIMDFWSMFPQNKILWYILLKAIYKSKGVVLGNFEFNI